VTDVERTLHLPFPTPEVWNTVAAPELLGEWFDGAARIELVPGGELVVERDDGTRQIAIVEDVAAPHRLAFSWRGDDGRGARTSTVEIELVPRDDGTDVHVRETLAEFEVPRVPFTAPVSTPRPYRGEALALARV
jgi:uncharacterized protein YndB with AHSA1/START domain